METIRVSIGLVDRVDADMMLYAKQLGIESVQIEAPKIPGDQYWKFEDLLELRSTIESYGMKLEAIENVPVTFYDKIMVGLPGRDEQIAHYCETIRNIGKAGIPNLGYHFMPNQVWRTSAETPGRGGTKVWSYNETLIVDGNKMQYDDESPLTVSLQTEEQMWSNYEYFVKAVMPVAEKANVRLALHPDDPPMPVVNGVTRLFYKPENFIKAMNLANSSAWGLNLCLGCCSEMVGRAKTVHEMIDFFGPKGRIFYVHFRDVQGSVPNFKECFLGEGNYKPAEVMNKLISYGFNGFLLDDHVPTLSHDTPWGHRGHAHAIGYLQGIIEAIR